jgi:hypothetical protein
LSVSAKGKLSGGTQAILERVGCDSRAGNSSEHLLSGNSD